MHLESDGSVSLVVYKRYIKMEYIPCDWMNHVHSLALYVFLATEQTILCRNRVERHSQAVGCGLYASYSRYWFLRMKMALLADFQPAPLIHHWTPPRFQTHACHPIPS